MLTAALIATLGLNTAPRPGVMWFTDLKQGYIEAKATNKPIFLMAAAPQCSEVPGDW